MAYSNGVNIADPITPTQVANVKAASTAAVAADEALVVAISPNNQVSVVNGGLAEATAAWTSATAQNTALQINTAGFSTVILTLNQGTTISGGTVTFEVSDTTAFTNAYSITGYQVNNNTSLQTSYNLAANSNVSFAFNVQGYAAFRVRLSTAITGSATVNVGLTPSAQAYPYLALAQVSTVSQAGVRSNGSQAIIADNKINTNLFYDTSSNANGLYVSESTYGGAFSGSADAARQGWNKRRAATVFKTASVSATASGNTAVWTPGSGNKFRLLGFEITATNITATAATVITISFQDATAGMPVGTFDVLLPAATGATNLLEGGTQQISSGWVNLGDFGVLSAAANNVLNANISATVTGATGTFRVSVAGTEE